MVHICDAMCFHWCMAECVRPQRHNLQAGCALVVHIGVAYTPSWCIFAMHALPSVHGRPCACPGGAIYRQVAPSCHTICDAMHLHQCMAECVCLGGTNYRQAAPLWRLFVDGTCVLLMHDRPCVCPGGTIFTQARQARQAAPSYVVFSSCMHFHWCMAECGCPCGTIYDFCLL